MQKKMFEKQNILKRLFSFSGRIERSEFWSELFIRLIGLICASILLCLVISVTVPLDTEVLIEVINWGMPFFALIWMIPVVALTRRRLRDAGFSARSYLWLLLPVAGWIVFVIRLCRDSVEET